MLPSRKKIRFPWSESKSECQALKNWRLPIALSSLSGRIAVILRKWHGHRLCISGELKWTLASDYCSGDFKIAER